MIDRSPPGPRPVEPCLEERLLGFDVSLPRTSYDIVAARHSKRRLFAAQRLTVLVAVVP